MTAIELRNKVKAWVEANGLEFMDIESFGDDCVNDYMELIANNEESLTIEQYLETNKNNYKLESVLEKRLGYGVTIDVDFNGLLCVMSDYFNIHYTVDEDKLYTSEKEFYDIDESEQNKTKVEIESVLKDNIDIVNEILYNADEEPIDFGTVESSGAEATMQSIFGNGESFGSGFGDSFDPSVFGMSDDFDFDVEDTDEEVFDDTEE